MGLVYSGLLRVDLCVLGLLIAWRGCLLAGCRGMVLQWRLVRLVGWVRRFGGVGCLCFGLLLIAWGSFLGVIMCWFWLVLGT